jgi:hypothetical protein
MGILGRAVSSVFVSSVAGATGEVLDGADNSVLEEEAAGALEDLLENFCCCALDMIAIKTPAETVYKVVNSNNNNAF